MSIPSYTALSLRDVPLVDSWSMDEPYAPPMKTEMEGANKRLRTRPGDETAKISFDLLYSQYEFAIWREFARDTLGRGSSRFTMRVWNGYGMVSKTVQLVDGTYKVSNKYPKVVVGFELYVFGGL